MERDMSKNFITGGAVPGDYSVGCVNVDAGRERLEDLGWEVTDWGAV
jgi:hypothetical protein